jgi:hypothetical protein
VCFGGSIQSSDVDCAIFRGGRGGRGLEGGEGGGEEGAGAGGVDVGIRFLSITAVCEERGFVEGVLTLLCEHIESS